MNTIIPDEPAFPNDTFDGIPIRLYIAAQIMAGAASQGVGGFAQSQRDLAQRCLWWADSLIDAYNKEKK